MAAACACRGASEGIDSFIIDEQPETTPPIDEKHFTFFPGFIVWPFVILLLYVLSTGPVLAMAGRGRIPYGFVRKFYGALTWTYLE